jgi:preprotein translocase subunit SecF
MLSGTYSSIFIATPVLADLKEREPQYQALAKRVAVRATGGRAAKRSAAKAEAGARPGTASPGLLAEEAQADDFADDVDGEPSDEFTTTASRVPGGPASSVRPGPRQQPRRSSGGARHRPAGKKKRR